jgi:hypothetical protein
MATHEDKTASLWRGSTRESIAAEQPNGWAILETILAVALWWWLAYHNFWFWGLPSLLLSVFAAPLLLMRSEGPGGSAQLGKKWFLAWEKNWDSEIDQNHSFEMLTLSKWLIVVIVAIIAGASSYATSTFFAGRYLVEQELWQLVVGGAFVGWLGIVSAVSVAVVAAVFWATAGIVAGPLARAVACTVTLSGITCVAAGFMAAGGAANAGVVAIVVAGVGALVIATTLKAAGVGAGAVGKSIVQTVNFVLGPATTGMVVFLARILAVPFLLPIGFVLGLAVGLVSLGIRLAATILHPILGIRSVAQNFSRLILCTAPSQPPELLPGLGQDESFFVVRQAWRVVPQGTVWPGWYPADDLEVEVLCGPWVWEPLAEQQGCPERSGI